MEIMEAYNRTVEAAIELREEGIDIKITASSSSKTEEMGRLPRDKWIIIQFFVKTSAQAVAVAKKADELGWFGMRFDTGGHPGEREWEIDWSFDVGATPDGEWQDARRQVEDMIDGKGEDGPEAMA